MNTASETVLTWNLQFSSYSMLRFKLYDIASLSRLSGRFASPGLELSCVQCLVGFHDGAHRHWTDGA